MKNIIATIRNNITIIIVSLLLSTSITASAYFVIKNETKQTIAETILNNPELIIQTIKTYNNRMQKQNKESLVERFLTTIQNKNYPSDGEKSASVTIYEFMDYQCGYCKRFQRVTKSIIEKNSDVKIVYIDFPILGENSTTAAKAAIASIKQGKYMDFHNALMTARSRLNEDIIFKIAKENDINVKTLQAEMAKPYIQDTIQYNLQLGQALGIKGTPYSIVVSKNGSKVLPGFVDEDGLAKTIEQLK